MRLLPPAPRATRFAVALLLLCATLPARADDDLKTLLRRGVALRREHRNEEALAVFQRAVALSPEPSVLAQRGLAEQALGCWTEAARDLDAALAAPGDPWIAKNEASLVEARAVVRAHLGSAKEDAAPEVAVAPPAPPPSSAPAPPVPSALPAVAMAAPTDEPALAPLSPAVLPDRAPSLTGPLTLGAVGLLGLGAGTYFGIRTFEYKGDRDAQCAAGATGGCKPAALTYDADARAAATTSTVAFGAGLACLVAGTAWWLLERASVRPPAPVQIAPMIGPGRGLVLEGRL